MIGFHKTFHPNVCVCADANASVGYGHVMRCLAVAEVLKKLGVAVNFLMEPSSDHALVEANGYDVIVLKQYEFPAEQIIAALRPENSLLLFDSYAISFDDLEKLHSAGFVVALFDDGMRLEDYGCGLVIDCAPGASTLPYRGFPETRFCLGADYFPLRQEFKKARGKEGIADRVKTIIVTFGGSDPDDVTHKVLNAMANIDGDFEIVAVLGPAYAGRAVEAPTADGRVKTVRSVLDMGALMVTADLAICGGGCTALELAYLGVPMVVLPLSPDQMPLARSLAGAALCLEGINSVRDTDIVAAIRSLLNDKYKRQNMHFAGRALVDGLGSERVASAILSITTKDANKL